MTRLALVAAWVTAWAFALVLLGSVARTMVELFRIGWGLWP